MIDTTHTRSFKGLLVGLFAGAAGAVVLCGWLFDIPSLKSVLPGLVTMKANTAVGFILAGLSLALLGGAARVAWTRQLSRASACATALLGLLTLCQYLFGLDFGIDQLLFREPAGAVGTVFLGRMAPTTALNFLLLGSALFLAGSRRTIPAAQRLVLLAGLMGLLPLAGYLYGATALIGIGRYTQMAIHTAALFVLLSLGVLLLHPADGLMRAVASDTIGGWLLRRLAPFVIGVPLALGWLRVQGEQRGYFNGPLGVALMMVVLMLILASLIAWTARALNRIDAVRRQAEATVREREENLAVTLRSIGDGVLATDAEGRVTHLNPAAELLTGWTEAEAKGRPVGEVFCIISEETRQPAVVPVDNVLQTGEIYGLANHTVLVARDGTERPIADSAAPIRDREGGLLGVVLVFRDVAEQRRAEREIHRLNEGLEQRVRERTAELRESDARFRLMVESVKDYAIIMLDAGGHVVSWNAGAERIKGYKTDEIVGQHFSRFYPKEAVDRGKPEQELAVAVAEGRFEDEAWRVRKDGSRFWASVVITAMRDEAGQLRGFAKVTRDITERKRAEEEIRKLNAELEQRVRDRTAQLEAANKELEAFAYSVSHDLRAPLRHVNGFVELLQSHAEAALDDKGKRYLGIIADSSRQLGLLIDDLLSFSRMGRTEMSHRPVKVADVAQEAVQELEGEVQGRKVEWRIGELPVVMGDRPMLKLALVNLLGNALKYTRPREQALIEIGCFTKGGETVIFIRDNGVGFSMEYAHKLFCVFQRLHNSDEFEGTGIGLANVRRIIERHGGRTWAEGVVNEGATFYFSLPRKKEEPS